MSKSTAAYILSSSPNFQTLPETRKKVLEAAQALGYRRNAIAVALSSGQINAIGVFLPLQMGDHEKGRSLLYFKEVLAAVAGAAARRNLRIMPILVDQSRTLTGQDLSDQWVDRLIVTFPASPETFAALEAANLPCVGFGSASGRHTVEADNRGGAAAAIDYLVSLGHQRILHYSHDPGSTANHQRREGFLAAMDRHGLTVSAKQAIIPDNRRDELRRRFGLPPGERPTAVFAYADAYAVQVMDIAHDAGLRVPQDISVIGFDDGAVAVLTRPKLTTVVNPLETMADACLDLLAALHRGEEPPAGPLIPTTLTIRDSTAPAPP
ncbi:MAG: LacI family DNA-binding transcriptional regulator [Cytophagales bacterium]|nr:LacI family DNA-binding transcriptional regulator [Armatimonadota bacterium]